MIKKLAIILSLSSATAAMADGPICSAAVTEKLLAGAASTSLLKKCFKDAVD